MTSAVRLVSITHGAEYEIDLSPFAEADLLFAYVDDLGCGVEPLRGLVADGRVTIEGRPPFMWLDGPRDCALLRVTEDGRRAGRVALRSLAVGEFCLEIYRMRPGAGAELLHSADFCFK